MRAEGSWNGYKLWFGVSSNCLVTRLPNGSLSLHAGETDACQNQTFGHVNECDVLHNDGENLTWL